MKCWAIINLKVNSISSNGSINFGPSIHKGLTATSGSNSSPTTNSSPTSNSSPTASRTNTTITKSAGSKSKSNSKYYLSYYSKSRGGQSLRSN